ncbi:MAG: hypothetical protein H0T91_10590 [Propionibacteriaceae bacterium]|nr:hypothetical protein [Propionibacteriaceae bacterium]
MRASRAAPGPTWTPRGTTSTFTVSKLDFTSLQSTPNTTVTATLNGDEIGTFAVSGGEAPVSLEVPASAATGPGTLALTGNTGTTITLPVAVK